MLKAAREELIKGPRGVLAASIHLPSRTPCPVVVCCHGLLSSRKSDKLRAIGEWFSAEGLGVVRFDFTGCGDTLAGPGKSLLESRREDLQTVMEFVQGQPWAGTPIHLLGSSLGGYLALLAAGENDLGAVACWATPFDLRKIKDALSDFRNFNGMFPAGHPLGGPETLENLAPVPRVLIVHGQRDALVPWWEATEIYSRLGDPKRLYLMEGADHRFLDPSCRRLAMDLSLDWLRSEFSSKG